MNTDTEPPSVQSPSAGSRSIAVEISDTQAFVPCDRRALTQIVRDVLAGEGVREASISVALVDNATIRTINRRHLNHDWPTDVISFRLSDEAEPELSGELVISAEMAAATAGEANVEPFAELALYLTHGLLHLCGYDDGTDGDAASMRRREDEVLARLGLINPFPLVGSAADGTEIAARENLRWPV
jgi:probable rRNA maturation factor